MELDRVALAHANETAGHRAAERPERVGHALGDFLVDFGDFEVDDDLRRMRAFDRRRNLGGLVSTACKARPAAARSRLCASRRYLLQPSVTRVADSRVQPLSASAAVHARRIICCLSTLVHPDVWICLHSDAGRVQVLYEDPLYDAVAAALACSAVSAA